MQSGSKNNQAQIGIINGMGDVIFNSCITNPDWYFNVLANPRVSVELGNEKFDALATVANEPDRTEIFAKMVASYPDYAEYQQKTDRVFPVITLSRLR